MRLCLLFRRGLSPRVRGNLANIIAPSSSCGSIPACAGEPSWITPGWGWARVYPRVCGGTRRMRSPALSDSGLSPRVRGNPSADASRRRARGSIPACAGEPGYASHRGISTRVYPRVCGGTHAPLYRATHVEGLSPRVRGNRALQRLGQHDLGSIPACAGEPRAGLPAPLRRRVYPRVCGGTVAMDRVEDEHTGLSPRVRGNRLQVVDVLVDRGSIPACAGEPRGRGGSLRCGGVYPRVCGGTAVGDGHARVHQGLSPRVRGNPVGQLPEAVARGSIPACAGEPSRRAATPWTARVYPRVCGGTDGLGRRPFLQLGLSPRVRGNQAAWNEADLPLGSIPACAGEPAGRHRRCGSGGVYPRVCGGTDRERDHRAHARGLSRVCGGTITHGDEEVRWEGLSPRVRGNRSCPARRRAARGSIPACAGEPELPLCRRRHDWVYPRVCGGTRPPGTRPICLWGLSPRVRGNLTRPVPTPIEGGSIPACAGEPSYIAGSGANDGVYPRVCGGTIYDGAILTSEAGLSPRVRGNRRQRARRRYSRGSIPACAGEPCSRRWKARGLRVYPRVCGGTVLLDPEKAPVVGLSPRVRGNQSATAGSTPSVGSIPACAGEPPPGCSRCSAAGVYPRVCGGTGGDGRMGRPRPGLSPRVRGNPRRRGTLLRGQGSIPACAGEPRGCDPWRRRGGVYPRVCGGTASSPNSPLMMSGLSPRVRGNHVEVVASPDRLGSIPACAGEPEEDEGEGRRL